MSSELIGKEMTIVRNGVLDGTKVKVLRLSRISNMFVVELLENCPEAPTVFCRGETISVNRRDLAS